MRFCVAFLTLFCIGCEVHSQCPSCPVPRRVSYEWRPTPSGKQVALYTATEYLGNFIVEGDEAGIYFPRRPDGEFGPACDPPAAVPNAYVERALAFRRTVKVEANYGLDLGRIQPGQTTLNGREVSRKEALDAIAAPTLPDDRARLRLTVIGDEPSRQRVLSDLATSPDLSPYRDKLLVQDYAPGEWPLSCGFVVKGNPTIYLQQPDGKVLHRQDDYADGAAGLAAAIRKVDPNYKPDADADRRKPELIPGLPLENEHLLLGGAVLALLFLAYRGNKQ